MVPIHWKGREGGIWRIQVRPSRRERIRVFLGMARASFRDLST